MKDNQDNLKSWHVYKKRLYKEYENLVFSLELNYVLKHLKKRLVKNWEFQKDNKINCSIHHYTKRYMKELNDYKFAEKENGRIRQFKKELNNVDDN